jgi:hypothetical protein
LTSDRKIKADRANARASTGPKTHHGRARSTRNTFRYGLSLPIQHDQALCEEVQELARQIAGLNCSAHVQLLALRVAEAHVDLHRIRSARHQFLSEALAGHNVFEDSSSQADGMESHEAISDAQAGRGPLAAFVERFLTAADDGPGKLAIVVSKGTKRLQAFDRYERRALSRRKSAIQTLDEARQQST